MAAFIDITGQKFGRLVVIRRTNDKGGKGKSVRWHCICECGTTMKATTSKLRSGEVKSCGCLMREKQLTKGHLRGLKHGFCSRTKRVPEYTVWQDMLQRVYNPKHVAFSYYGERGITVCQQWRSSFETFFSDMGPRPTNKHTIDRVNNDLGYSPENCRWATRLEQVNNRRNNRFVVYDGRRLTISELADQYGICRQTLRQRILKLGWPINKALSTPRRKPYR